MNSQTQKKTALCIFMLTLTILISCSNDDDDSNNFFPFLDTTTPTATVSPASGVIAI